MPKSCMCLVAVCCALAGCSPCKRAKRLAVDPRPGGDSGGDRVLLAGPRPPVRDARAEDGSIARARLLLSKLTPTDGVRIALVLTPPPPAGGDGGTPSPGHYDWAATAASLRLVIRPPSGAERTLELAAPPRNDRLPAGHVHTLVVSGEGLQQRSGTLPWKSPISGAFAASGRYSLRIDGKLHGEGQPPLPFSLPPMPFEVVEASPSFLTVGQIVVAAIAGASSRVELAGKADELTVIDDAGDGRWVRLAGAIEREDRDHVVDVLLTPSGKVVAIQDFHHFGCVAEGTPVATPSGDRSVEDLAPGDRLWAFDVDMGRRVEVDVLAVTGSTRRDLVLLDGATLTAEHPVFVDGQWARADAVRAGSVVLGLEGIPRGLGSSRRVARTTRVFDVTVSEPHTFFAGGLLVHNKSVAVPLGGADAWGGLFLRATDGSASAPGPSHSTRPPGPSPHTP